MMSETHHLDRDIPRERLADLDGPDLTPAGQRDVDASHSFNETHGFAYVEDGVHVITDESDGRFESFAAGCRRWCRCASM